MEDWKDKIEAWEKRLSDWNARFEAEYERLARDRRRWFRKLGEGEQADIAAAARKLAGEDTAVELFVFLSQLCDAYLAESLPQNRAKTRAWIGASFAMLRATWSYAAQAPDLVRKPSDGPILLRGLAAVSLDDVRTDFNAVLGVLGDLWIAARRAGIDPAPHFAKVAAISNPGMGGGGAFMQELMRDFGESAYFRDRVRPRLPRASA